MSPECCHAVPESAYFKVPETLKTFRMYPISRFVCFALAGNPTMVTGSSEAMLQREVYIEELGIKRDGKLEYNLRNADILGPI